MNNFQHSFPFEMLPKAGDFPLPKFQAAIQECLNARKVPVKMPYFTAAAAYCSAAQLLFDVETPNGGKFGTNIYALVSANSGEGKTSVRHDFFRAFDEIQSDLKHQFNQAEASYQQQEDRWKREEQVLSANLATAVKKGLDIEAIKERCDEHDRRKPAGPREFNLSMKEPKYAPLLRALTDFPCTTIISSDCAMYLRSSILPSDTLFCDTWSHETINDPRVSVASYYCEDPRLAMLLMIQPNKLASIVKSVVGAAGLDSGLFARMVYCSSERSNGGRFLDINSANMPVETRYRDEFNRNMKEILLEGVQAISSPGYSRKVLRFGTEAAKIWMLYFNYIEEQRQLGGRYERANDCAARLAENAARMAAGFHAAERFEGDEIGVECLLSAIAICDHSSQDYMKTFIPEDPDEVDAMHLYEWLREKLGSQPTHSVGRVPLQMDYDRVSTVSRLSPSRRMRGKKVHKLLDILVRKGLIEIFSVPGARGQTTEKVRLISRPQ
ncbi:hypothetical protein GGR63_000113 [Xanthomonas sp. 3272]|uniref:DUF3987 domain-containing protein n=1 Tax=Xanthomonas arboricola TaxID=56448 RepID=UPI00142FCF9C|nr:DUF3987 domain-containing protein [Xanthomonas arboricola]NJC00226.1 hypothetical protein [Xanthomonas arboricola]